MYQAADTRYDGMTYNRCGSSGLRLPAVSLGFWHNFGSTGVYETMRKLCFTAFDNGVTHFDLANNYGPEPGSAEENLGRIVKENFMPYRDELIISTKAGYEMWNGPYGNWGSRKYLLASLDQSLTRLGLPYVDIFYHHRMDPETPLEETMGALDQAVKSGKALYAGLSNYNGQKMQEAAAILRDLKCPFVKFYDTEALRIIDIVAEYSRALFLGRGSTQAFHKSLTLENIITQNHRYGIIPNKLLAYDKSLCQSIRARLYSIA